MISFACQITKCSHDVALFFCFYLKTLSLSDSVQFFCLLSEPLVLDLLAPKEKEKFIEKYYFTGFIEVCFMHPLDLIKTRIQIQSNKTSIILPNGNDSKYRYNGIIDCLIKISKYEGISSFYKGILPPLMAETPKRAIKVGFYIMNV